MYLIGLFKVAGHFRQKLILTDAHIHGEPEFIPDPILDGVGQGHRIRIDPMCSAHVQITFVDAGLLNHGSILPADIHELPGVFFIEFEVWPCHEKIRTFPQSHTNGFSSLDTAFLSRNRFCQHHAGALLPISADHCRDQTDIRFSVGYPSGSFPGQVRTIHINMEHELAHGSHLLNLIHSF